MFSGKSERMAKWNACVFRYKGIFISTPKCEPEELDTDLEQMDKEGWSSRLMDQVFESYCIFLMKIHFHILRGTDCDIYLHWTGLKQG
jgi:hypothetical protein